MTITLYSTSSPAKTVTKQLSNAKQCTGAFRNKDNPSDRNPVIVIEGARNTLNSYNYAYIPDFGAYYFIREKNAVSANTTELIMKKDVLMTFDAGIRNQSAIINRQASSSYSDVDLDDEMLVVKRSELETLTLSNYGNHTATIVLAVSGV
jgi:hypothetical protein